MPYLAPQSATAGVPAATAAGLFYAWSGPAVNPGEYRYGFWARPNLILTKSCLNRIIIMQFLFNRRRFFSRSYCTYYDRQLA